MRAIQITEFGGPEVLKVVEVPDPVAVDGFDLVEVTRLGRQLRRHPPGRELLPVHDRAADGPGQRGRRH